MNAADHLPVRIERQRNPVADEVAALVAIVRPILQGMLYALKSEVVWEVRGYDNVALFMLPRLYRPGDGDCGICFEYAVHDAMNRRVPDVLERVVSALKSCNVPGTSHASILFGAEKAGALKLIDTANSTLTDDSRVLVGKAGQPVKLKGYLNQLAAALRRKDALSGLPYSISGLWKADLFLGTTDADRWVGTSVKINPRALEAARGLRIGIVPAENSRTDRVHFDESRNLVVCPLRYDAAFMEKFYQAWGIVQQFIAADAKLPPPVALPRNAERQVASYLVDRRSFTVLEVIDALTPLAQPELLQTEVRNASLKSTTDEAYVVGAVIAPQPRSTE
ncbi:MAG: hypothetical protein JWM87_3161 [Candidatus Eremiobacteraeota bacterium]|nr:hypothetical protein [Candidatus Eremiobacteraeota bacterium]